MDRSDTNSQGNVMELSGNFTLSGEWSPWVVWTCRSTVAKWKWLDRLGFHSYRFCFQPVLHYVK